jgi:hypothetical protein
MDNIQALSLLLFSEEYKQELIATLESQDVQRPNKRERKRIQDQANTNNASYNLTALYIESEYDSLFKKLSNIAYGKAKEEDVQDFILGYLADLIRKDTLDSYLSDGKIVKFSVLASWFKQYMTRQWQYFGKDCNTRTLTGARSQLEEKTGTLHVWHDPNPAQAIALTDGDGNVNGSDFVRKDDIENEAEIKLFAEDLSRVVKETLIEEYDDNRADYLFKVFETSRDEPYDNKADWARKWGITRSQLDRDIKQVESAIRSIGKEAFGY